MRILTVCPNLGRGGTQRVAQNFTLAYQRLGHQVACLAHSGGGPRQYKLESDGVPVFLGETDILSAVEQAKQFQPDLIHIHRPGMQNAFETELLKRLRHRDCRVVETNVFARPDFSEAASLIDIHFQLSAWCMWRWRHWLGKRSMDSAGVVVPNAVESGDFVRASPADVEGFRKQYNIPSDAFVCGRVGQPSPSNWHPSIIRAFEQLAEKDRSAHLLLLGLPPQLRRMLDSLPASTRSRIREIPLTDCDAQLATLYSSLDCFLHCAAAGESFGLVICEALLCGVPAVTAATPHKSNTQIEIVQHMKNGVVAGSASLLGDALLLLRANSELRSIVANGARNSIVSRYHVDEVAVQALRAAAIAHRAKSRLELIEALNADPQLKVGTSDPEVEIMLRNTLGKRSRIETTRMRLIHNPFVYRLNYSALQWLVYRKYSRRWPM
jgi:glycosyltransferase involved in cell wall biosynthesis